ncbi:short-chain dehydrogenase/reductase 3-like [Argonauta hians]
MPSGKKSKGKPVTPERDDGNILPEDSFLMKVINVLHFILFVCYGLISTIFTALKGYWKIIRPQKKKDITQEVILITGGGRGLGKRIALEFAKHSPKQIILWGRNLDCLAETSAQVCELGVACVYMQCDVSNKDNIEQQASICQERYGPVSILVNNAGVMYGGKLLDLEEEDIEMSFKVNVLAHFRTIRSFLPSMQESGHGHIVTIGSCLGLMAINQTGAYASSKHALTAFSESLSYISESNGYTGVNTTMVYPFQINNEMFEGCISRFPKIFPLIDEEYVAQKTVEATLTNTVSVIIPKHLTPIFWIKTIIPVEVTTMVSDFFGITSAMQTYTGGKKNSNNKNGHNRKKSKKS